MDKIWTYIISKELSNEALGQLSTSGKAFVSSWTAHDNPLHADFRIFKNKIIVVKVNEAVHSASGCSIDKLVRFIKESEVQFGIELLNRFLVAYQTGEQVEVVHASKVKELLAQNILNENTIVYNTAVASEEELQHWEQPLKSSWLSKYLVKA